MATRDDTVSQRSVNLDITGPCLLSAVWSLPMTLKPGTRGKSSPVGQVVLGPALFSWEILRTKMAALYI